MLNGNGNSLALSKYLKGQPSGGSISLTDAHFILTRVRPSNLKITPGPPHVIRSFRSPPHTPPSLRGQRPISSPASLGKSTRSQLLMAFSGFLSNQSSIYGLPFAL